MQFKELLQKQGIETRSHGQHHHTSRGWVSFDCPYCSPGSGRFRMGFNLSGSYINCWVCGPHNIVETIQKLTGMSYGDVRSLLEGLTPTEAVRARPALRQVALPRGVGELHPVHRDYLEARRFNVNDICTLWGIQAIGLAARLQWRIFIPVLLGKDIVSWTTRAISDNVSAKYISASTEEESFPLKDILYGEQYCRHCIVVNEGPLDAWAVGPGAVATCGVGYSRAQLLRMTRYPLRVIVFDREPDAQRRASKLCDDLAVFPGETYNVVLDSGKDASRASKKEIQKLREKFLE